MKRGNKHDKKQKTHRTEQMPTGHLGKWGQILRAEMKLNNPVLFDRLLEEGKLYDFLSKVDIEADSEY